ncbi:hypothetical protein DPSP01_012740 [Paraphaeosphaeria sporulosa]|uniref:GIY-YIG domain-containing protein n=1 Tax=Paraphaeosphaeria sporulosa TaxID=1460663 RepID=A0A177CZQ1_9PLEO|nr:uncharacterized protein CC84DRAFT_1109141 [Paraphaeosphaeria sporulosa]OAG12601.1 hypothetical protein CC84DRAFT_1109141 [Paraphaeosphaeria sporulosa]
MTTAEANVSGNASQIHEASLNMDTTPESLSPAQQEAQHILKHLLTKLQDRQSKYHARFAKWILRHPNLVPFSMDCVRPQVWHALEKGTDYNTIKAVAGDFPWQARGIYFDAVRGAPSDPHTRTRLYIGQSTNLRLRISQHSKFRYRRDNPSLHYHALHKSDDNAYGTLVVLPSKEMGGMRLPGMDDEGLLLDVMEMWMCLVFRCLQKETLETWLPGDVERRGKLGGLNVWAPVERYDRGGEMVHLRASEDWLVAEWGELKRGEWKERVMKELDLEERKEEKHVGPLAVEGAPPWVYAVGGAIGGAAVMWIVLRRVGGR